MPTNFQVNKNDLDTIFKPLGTTKRTNVGYSVSGTDISNFYEPTKNTYDQPISLTGLLTNGTDLKYVFQASGYYNVNRIDIVTTTESYHKYYRAYDGNIYVTVYTDYLKIVNGYASVTVTANASTATKTVYVGTVPPSSILFTFANVSYGTYTVTATDLYANKNRSMPNIVVTYNGASNTYNFY